MLPPASIAAAAVSVSAVSLGWQPPPPNRDGPLTGYEVSWGAESGAGTVSVGANVLSYTVTALLYDTYGFTVRAQNGTLPGLPAAATAAPQTPPSAPVNFVATALADGASLSWSAPASDGGASVTGYVLSYGAQTINLGATLAATVGGLTPGAEYAFTLQAANSAGAGAAATAAASLAATARGGAGWFAGKSPFFGGAAGVANACGKRRANYQLCGVVRHGDNGKLGRCANGNRQQLGGGRGIRVYAAGAKQRWLGGGGGGECFFGASGRAPARRQTLRQARLRAARL